MASDTAFSDMHNPPHPGRVLADTVLRKGEGGLSVSAFAKQLGIGRVTLSRVVNARAAVSTDLALRLAEALGGSPESWLRMQMAYDLWQAKHGGKCSTAPATRFASSGMMVRSDPAVPLRIPTVATHRVFRRAAATVAAKRTASPDRRRMRKAARRRK